jgi:hypothetical protein
MKTAPSHSGGGVAGHARRHRRRRTDRETAQLAQRGYSIIEAEFGERG